MTMKHSGRRLARTAAATVALTALTAGLGTVAQADPTHGLQPGNLLVSRSVYTPDTSLQAGITKLPAGCVTGCALANAGGAYPEVWDNDKVDESFGVTSNVFLDQLRPSGSLIDSLEVPSSTEPGVTTSSDQMVTSFSSKSELALNLSTGGRYVTFMGYLAPVDALDVSNANTPGVFDPTNPDPGADYRVVAQLDDQGRFQFTETNAYSGNNGRAAIMDEERHHHAIYTAGNAGNGANPQPDGIIVGAGAQILKPAREPELLQEPGFPTPLGSFSITQLGDKADKVGKDTNFRGLTIFDNVVYYTKGSGGNGVNTVYFLDTTGKACPTGVGLPAPGAKLPTWPLAYNPELLQSAGMKPYNMCILKGFPTALKTKTAFPFGIWFANANTLYVADEGNGENDLLGRQKRIHRGGRADDGRAAEVGIRHERRRMEARLHPAERPPSGPALHGRRLPDRQQPGHRPAVVARHRRAAQHRRSREPRRVGHDLGHHLDRQRQRRSGRRSEPARGDCRSPGRHHAAGRGGVHDGPFRRLRRGAARRLVHAGHRRVRRRLLRGPRRSRRRSPLATTAVPGLRQPGPPRDSLDQGGPPCPRVSRRSDGKVGITRLYCVG